MRGDILAQSHTDPLHTHPTPTPAHFSAFAHRPGLSLREMLQLHDPAAREAIVRAQLEADRVQT
jgi:hypothetical protein